MSQQELGEGLDEDIRAVVVGRLMTLDAVRPLHELQEYRDEERNHDADASVKQARYKNWRSL